MSDSVADLDEYEASIWRADSDAHVADFREAWLAPLLRPLAGEAAARSRAASLRLAEAEGVRLFRVAAEGGAEAEAAAGHFHEFGFSVLLDAVQGDELRSLQRTSADLVRRAVRACPFGNRGHHRYSLHRTTMVRACLELVDNAAICAVLQRIWSSPRFHVQCTGGDFSLPSAEKQRMHADIGSRHRIGDYFAFHDPMHPGRGYCDLPAPVVKVYVAMVDFNEENGPPLFVPGSHWRFSQEDVPEEDPPGSRRAFCPQGSAIVMDMRVWHHGTPNRSEGARPMLSVHYAGPWYSEEVLRSGSTHWQYHKGALTREAFESLRPRARKLCKHLAPPTPEECCAQCGRASARSGQAAAAPKQTWLDMRRAMGFKNLDLYCVAPIVHGEEQLASYDFWAVGINCCSGVSSDFRCGEFNNPHARSGLRLMRDDQRPFFRLAVQQAEAAYNIKATHPLFFYWMQDPVAEINAYRDDGFKYYLLGIFTHFAFNLFCVVCAVVGFSKIGQF